MLAWGAIVIPIDGPVAAASAGVSPACPDGFPQGQFGDIRPDNVHRRAVDCSASWRVVDGVRLGEYGPAATLTRGQAASMVVRLIIVAGGALPPSPGDAFADDAGSVHEGAIDQLAAAGVIDGTAPGVYQPGAPVTRDQLTTILQGALDNRGAAAASSAEDLFTDDDGSVHEASINALVTAGVLSGRAPGVFEPRGPARRDQVATAMVGVLDRLVAQGLAVRQSRRGHDRRSRCTDLVSDGPGHRRLPRWVPGGPVRRRRSHQCPPFGGGLRGVVGCRQRARPGSTGPRSRSRVAKAPSWWPG